jgi:tetratricopeptide (TPR) repeat protein
LAHPTALKLQPIRVSQLCLRSAYLHEGNALAALGRNDDARDVYKKVLPMLENEPRCGRLDWERSSIYVNIGNTFSRQGKFDEANEQYNIAEKLGKDHVDVVNGNKTDGMGIMIVAMRHRAFALKKAGREDEAKQRLREVLEMQLQLNAEEEKQKAKDIAEKEQIQLQQQVDNNDASDVTTKPTEPVGHQVAVA